MLCPILLQPVGSFSFPGCCLFWGSARASDLIDCCIDGADLGRDHRLCGWFYYLRRTAAVSNVGRIGSMSDSLFRMCVFLLLSIGWMDLWMVSYFRKRHRCGIPSGLYCTPAIVLAARQSGKITIAQAVCQIGYCCWHVLTCGCCLVGIGSLQSYSSKSATDNVLTTGGFAQLYGGSFDGNCCDDLV